MESSFLEPEWPQPSVLRYDTPAPGPDQGQQPVLAMNQGPFAAGDTVAT
jgi:hypothetical protein